MRLKQMIQLTIREGFEEFPDGRGKRRKEYRVTRTKGISMTLVDGKWQHIWSDHLKPIAVEPIVPVLLKGSRGRGLGSDVFETHIEIAEKK